MDDADRVLARPAWLVRAATELAARGTPPRLVMALCRALADLELDRPPVAPTARVWDGHFGRTCGVFFGKGRRYVCLTARPDPGPAAPPGVARVELTARGDRGGPYPIAGAGPVVAARAALARLFPELYPLAEVTDEVYPEPCDGTGR